MARRRSTKIAHLAPPGPSDAQLEVLLRLAAHVPDHGKLAPWRFVVIEGEGAKRASAKLAEIIANDPGVDETRRQFARTQFTRAPLCVMVVSSTVESIKVPEWEQIHSAGAACFTLLIAAHAMGFAGCWLTEWPAFDARVRAALGLTLHERVAGFVYLGTPTQGATERFRPDVASRVSRF